MLIYTVRPISERSTFTGRHTLSDFTVTWVQVLDLLEREVSMLNGKHLVLEVDATERDIRNDGMLRADAKLASPAVRIAFESKHGPIIMATDRFVRTPGMHYIGRIPTREQSLDGIRRKRREQMPDWQHNVYAIALALEALRKIDRYSVNHSGDQYKGYKAIEGSGPDLTAARDILYKYADYTKTASTFLSNQAAFTIARRKTHPDANNGDRAAWDDVEAAGRLLGLL